MQAAVRKPLPLYSSLSATVLIITQPRCTHHLSCASPSVKCRSSVVRIDADMCLFAVYHFANTFRKPLSVVVIAFALSGEASLVCILRVVVGAVVMRTGHTVQHAIPNNTLLHTMSRYCM